MRRRHKLMVLHLFIFAQYAHTERALSIHHHIDGRGYVHCDNVLRVRVVVLIDGTVGEECLLQVALKLCLAVVLHLQLPQTIVCLLALAVGVAMRRLTRVARTARLKIDAVERKGQEQTVARTAVAREQTTFVIRQRALFFIMAPL